MDLKTIEKLTSENYWKTKSNLNRNKIQRLFNNFIKKFDNASVSTSFLNGKFVSVNFYIRDELLENFVELNFRFLPKDSSEKNLNFKTEVDSLPEIKIIYKGTIYNSYEDYNKAFRTEVSNKIKTLEELLTKLENIL